ncbi:Phosphate-specific transport system accessory protein PhoU [Nymphon striatum]|nr:Phosphate-specific transport system accessory protein PhoU [Nymphon striatum]
MNEETKHISSAFDRDLEGIQAQIMKMGGLVEASIMEAAKSLELRDEELAETVRQGDKVIDALEEQIQDEAARVIAIRAPTAVDLRVILSVMKMSANLERIGDLKQKHGQANRCSGADAGDQRITCRVAADGTRSRTDAERRVGFLYST